MQHHPELMEKLSNHQQGDLEIILAEICAHCSIIVDGVYDQNDLVNLARICTGRLKEMRPEAIPQIILPVGFQRDTMH